MHAVLKQPSAVLRSTAAPAPATAATSPGRRDVLIVHPGLQHAHQLAWALHDAGRLQSFWSGVPVRAMGQARPRWMPARAWHKLKATSLPADVLRARPAWWLGARVATQCGSPATRFKNIHRWQHLIDFWIAARVGAKRPAVFVGYENACLHSFAAAKAAGARCVLDAASFHYARGNALLPSSAPDFQHRIDDWKQREIDQADLILCCSELARESYLEGGVPASKVIALPLGATLPDESLRALQPPPLADGPMRFAYAGAMHTRKSIDLVLACFERLLSTHPGQAELHIYGGSDGGEWIAFAHRLTNVQHHGPLPQSDLYRALAGCHALLLPSRYDSFGMVVPESLAVGTPVIVSNQTGAKSIIEQHPGAGWVVEPTADAILARLSALLARPLQLQYARTHALAAAAHCTWEDYRQRAARVFQELFPSCP